MGQTHASSRRFSRRARGVVFCRLRSSCWRSRLRATCRPRLIVPTRRGELRAHLLQAAATQVERLERRPIEAHAHRDPVICRNHPAKHREVLGVHMDRDAG
jgi:hypothetical protein